MFYGAYEYDPDPTRVRSALITSSQNRYDLTHTRTALQNQGELPVVGMSIMQLLAVTAVGYGFAYAVRGLSEGDWAIPMSMDGIMEGARNGLPVAATYVAGVAIGRAWASGEDEDEGEGDDFDFDSDIALANHGNYPEFQALMVEWYESTLSRDERIRLARSLVKMMQYYGTRNLVARTALTPSMAQTLHEFATAHGYGV